MARKPSDKPSRKPRAEGNARPAQADFIHATVRPTDEGAWYSSTTKVGELAARYGGDVKVAASRNGAGVASVPLRVYRRTQGSKSAWASKRLTVYQRDRLKRDAGKLACKMAEFADDMEEVTDPSHPLVSLLSNFNIRDDGFNAIEDTEIALGLTGDAYWLKTWDSGDYPTELWPLKPQFVRCVPDRERFISGYVYGRGTDNEQTYDATAIIHFKRPSATNDYYGTGDLQACLIHADVSMDLALFWKAALDNACQPGLVISGAGVSHNNIDQLREAIDRRFRGVKKAAISAVLSGDIKVDKWAMEKTEFGNLEGAAEVRGMIARAFDLPIELLEMRAGGMSDGQGVGVHQWQMYGLKPRCKRMENRLNSDLVPDFYTLDPTLFVAFDNAVDQDEEALERRAVALFGANLYDRNTALSLLGEDAVDDEPVYAIDLTTRSAQAMQPVTTGPGLDTEDATDATDATTPEANPAATPLAGPDVQQTALNGAQVAALQELVRAAAAKEIPLEAVTPMMLISFPTTPAELIADLVASLTGFEQPKQPDPITAPGQSSFPAGEGKQPKPDAGGDPTESGKALEPSVTGTAVAAAPGSLRAHLEAHAGHGHKAAGDPAPDVPTDTFEQRLRDYFQSLHPVILNAVGEYLQTGGAGEMPAVLAGSKQATRGLVGVLMDGTTPAMQQGANAAVAEITVHAGTSDVDVWSVVPQDAIDYLRTENGKVAVDVLKGYDDQVRAKVSDAIADTIEDAPTPAKIQAAVAEQLPEVSQAKAATIAQTETQHAYAAGDRKASAESEFVIGYKWLVSGDPCPFCKAMGGKIVDKNSPFLAVGESITLPNGDTLTNDYRDVIGGTVHPGCVMPDTEIVAGSVRVAMRAKYRGTVCEIRTASGRVLTVTENHPVLTSCGFIPAGLLYERDHLVCRVGSERGSASDPHNHDRPPTAEQVFESVKVAVGVSSRRVPVAPEHLHGDGKSVHGEIEVVASNRLLWGGFDAADPEHIGHDPLVVALVPASLTPASDLDAVLLRLRLSAYGCVSGRNAPEPFIGACLRCGHQISVGSPTLGVAVASEPSNNSTAIDAESFGDCLDGLSALVELDQVVHIERREFDGHVYDLSTVGGAYVANGVIIHNCRCYFEKVYAPLPEAP